MKVAIYAQPGGHQARHADAFRDGLRRHDIKATIFPVDAVVDADLAVFWGHRRKVQIARQKAKGRRYLVMERGYVGDRFAWTSIGYDGLNGRADFCNENAPADRWERHFARLMKPWRRTDGYTLVMGQVRGDAALVNVDFPAWARGTIEDLKALGHDVRFRPHPKDMGQKYDCPTQGGALEEAMAGAAFVVTWSSNSGVDAALAGVPVVAMDRGSMAWDVAAHGLDAAGAVFDRTRWAHRLAYSQWTMDEISAGTAWEHLKHG